MSTRTPPITDSTGAAHSLHSVHNRPKRGKGWLVIVLAAVVGLAAIAVIFLARHWPFTEANIVADLADATSSRVEIKSFKETFLPGPGCIAEDVTFKRDGGSAPLITIQKLTIQGSYSGLLTKHVSSIRVDGTHIVVPPLGTGQGWPAKKSTTQVVVAELIAHGAVLEFISHDANKPSLKFEIPDFHIHDLGAKATMPFDTDVLNPKPPGEVHASGKLGPWREDNPIETAISGKYSFRRADLGAVHGIAGTLSSDGNFQGMLKQIRVEGSTDVPDFEVTRSRHQVHLATEFKALVDGTDGDVFLQEVNAHFGKTSVSSKGKVAGTPPKKGKTASIDMRVQQGRIEDVLFLFVKAPRAPLTGATSFTANAIIPPGPTPFMKKLELRGQFGIGGGRFTKEKTQDEIASLSSKARGEKEQQEDPETVLSDLSGQVVVRNGVATFSELSFSVPGARARMHGTFNLLTEKIDLHGVLLLDKKLSQTTSGVKSFLLKALDPFLKKNRRGGAKMPVSITGTYSHPSYSADPV